MLHKQVRARGDIGAVINMPKEFVGQKCLALYDDQEESQRWFDAVTDRAKLPSYKGPRGPGPQQNYNRY